jgi:hypothetical protein
MYTNGKREISMGRHTDTASWGRGILTILMLPVEVVKGIEEKKKKDQKEQ